MFKSVVSGAPVTRRVDLPLGRRNLRTRVSTTDREGEESFILQPFWRAVRVIISRAVVAGKCFPLYFCGELVNM